jgi:pre-mRNA-splicing factor ATP-dependent RNA helicase DHX15/PRP43
MTTTDKKDKKDKKDKIGILDPDGINNNPLTNLPYSDTYRKWSKIWSKYPAYEKAEEIIEQIKDNQVLLIISGTGTGKTVLTPKYVLHALNYEGKVAITLPKQIIAKSAAEFASVTLDVKLGEEVGYQYKGAESQSKSNKTKLLYATDGTIVARLMNDNKLSEFDAVVIDEAHERKVQIDFLLYLLRNTLKLRPEFKLIIMSATINADIFLSYFSMFKMATNDIASKSNYSIESHYLPKPIDAKSYLDEGYSILKNIIANSKLKPNEARDILFFVASVNEANEICKRISADNIDGYCIEVYSGMSPEKEEIATKKDLYKSNTDKSRKIVIATPVAESSLTIDGLKYVIDSGYELFSYYDPDLDARVLQKQFVTQAQVKQRIGRAGRTEPGIAYHLYTEEQFKNMQKFPEPSIRTSNIYDECLKLIKDLKTTEKLVETLSNFIEPPREKYLRNSISQLRDLQLITNEGITELGNIIANLQMDPMAGLAVYAGKLLNCSYEIVKIMTVLETCKSNMGEIFMLPTDILSKNQDRDNSNQMKSLTNKFNKAKDKFKNKYGDHIALLNIFESYMEKKTPEKKSEFTYKYFLKNKTLDKAEKYYNKVRYVMKDKLKDIQPKSDLLKYDIKDRIIASIYFGYKLHMAFLKNNNYNTLKAEQIKISKNSYVSDKYPQQIIYHELFNNNGKMELNMVSIIHSSVEKIFIEL